VSKLKLGENVVSNAEYHADREYLSSSGLKLLLTDKEQFYREYVLNQRQSVPENDNFIFGSYLHSLILEPELVLKEYVIGEYSGRKSAEYLELKTLYPDKVIISEKQNQLASELLRAYSTHSVAPGLISNGESEKTLCVNLKGVKIKVRGDYVNLDKNYIVDVKTTSGATSKDDLVKANERYMYHLSAALYCMAFKEHYKRNFDFYWIYLSKFDLTCDVYKMSLKSMKRGIEQVNDALTLYKKNVDNDSWADYDIQEI